MTKFYVLFADEHCKLGRKSAPNQPVIVDKDYNLNWLFTDYLSYRRKFKSSALNTISKNAHELVRVLNYLYIEPHFKLESLTNSDLEGYIDSTEKNQPYRTRDVNRLVNALCWAQENGLFHEICGASDAANGIFYPVSVRVSRTGYKSSDFRRVERTQYNIELASDSAIEQVLDRITDRYDDTPKTKHKIWYADICERDILMLSLQLDAGLRGIEVCNMKIEHIPDRKSNTIAVEAETTQEIFIDKSKMNKSRNVSVSAILVMQLHDFIEEARPTLLEHRKINKNNDYRDSGFIFPSMHDGKAISTRQLYNIVSQDVPNVSPQVLRRNGLTNITKRAIEMLRASRGADYTDEDALLHTASQSGHEKPTTTERHYVKMHRVYESDTGSDTSTSYSVLAKLRKVDKENEELRAENEKLRAGLENES